MRESSHGRGLDLLGQGDWPPSSRSLLVWPGWSGSGVAAQTTGHPSSAAVVNRWLSVQGETEHLGVGGFESMSPASIMALFSLSKGCRKFLPGQGCQEAERLRSEQWAVDGLRGQALRWPHATSHWLGKPPEIPSAVSLQRPLLRECTCVYCEGLCALGHTPTFNPD